MRSMEKRRRIEAPIVTASLVFLLAVGIGYSGRTIDGSQGGSVARIERMRAELLDGECQLSADVQLTSRWSGIAFSFRQSSIREAISALLRTKNAYMVNTNASREALRYQMLSTVNELIGQGRATDLRITSFELL